MNKESLISTEAKDARKHMDEAVVDGEYERGAKLRELDPGIGATLMIAPRDAQLLTDRIYKVKTDLDRSVAIAKEFRQTVPVSEDRQVNDNQSKDRLLSAKETAALLGVKLDTLYRWSRAGKISHVRLSRFDLRFSRNQIDEFVASRSRKRKGAFAH
jgi:DNA binding domain, excisionase family